MVSTRGALHAGGGDLIHCMGRLGQRMSPIIALGHKLRQVAARNDEAAFAGRREAHWLLKSLQDSPSEVQNLAADSRLRCRATCQLSTHPSGSEPQ